MTTVGIATGAGRGMGLECARRLTGAVDRLLLVDRDEAAVVEAARDLTAAGAVTVVEPFVVDITDRAGVARLATRVRELGTLRAVAHAAGISPSMADWRRILTVDLVGTALLAEALRPLATAGTATVNFASMAAYLGGVTPDPEAAAILADPLDAKFLDRLRDAVGPSLEDPGIAYSWAKHGVHVFVQQEAVRIGPLGARVCSVSPGIIDTPQGRQEEASHGWVIGRGQTVSGAGASFLVVSNPTMPASVPPRMAARSSSGTPAKFSAMHSSLLRKVPSAWG